MKRSSIVAFSLLIALAATWGSAFLFIKIAVETIPPVTVAAARIVLAALIMVAVVRFANVAYPRGRKVWILMAAIGLIGNALPFFLISLGETQIDSGLAAILMSVIPLVTLTLAHFLFDDEKLTLQKVIGVMVGFSGLVFLVGGDSLTDLGHEFWFEMAVVGGAVCYAIRIILLRSMRPYHAVSGTAGVLVCSSAFMLPVSLIYDQPWTVSASMASILSLIVLAVLPTALATLLSFRLVAVAGVGYAAFTSYLVPVFGILWGTLFLNEELSGQKVIALAIIVAGISITRSPSGLIRKCFGLRQGSKSIS